MADGLSEIELLIAVFIALVGLAVGSFLNVVISRVPQRKSLMGRSACPRCGHSIRAYHNIPLLGWMILRGRCRDCALPIGRQYPMVEAATGALFVAVYLLIPSPTWVLLVTLLFFAAATIALTVIDWQTLRLPNAIVYPTVAVSLLGIALSVVVDPTVATTPAIMRVGASAAGLFVAYFLLWLISGGRAIGFGDVKLSVALGAVMGYFGYGVVAVGTMAAWVLGACIALTGLATGHLKRGEPVPFGPALIAGAWLGLFTGPAIWAWYSALAFPV